MTRALSIHRSIVPAGERAKFLARTHEVRIRSQHDREGFRLGARHKRLLDAPIARLDHHDTGRRVSHDRVAEDIGK